MFSNCCSRVLFAFRILESTFKCIIKVTAMPDINKIHKFSLKQTISIFHFMPVAYLNLTFSSRSAWALCRINLIFINIIRSLTQRPAVQLPTLWVERILCRACNLISDMKWIFWTGRELLRSSQRAPDDKQNTNTVHRFVPSPFWCQLLTKLIFICCVHPFHHNHHYLLNGFGRVVYVCTGAVRQWWFFSFQQPTARGHSLWSFRCTQDVVICNKFSLTHSQSQPVRQWRVFRGDDTDSRTSSSCVGFETDASGRKSFPKTRSPNPWRQAQKRAHTHIDAQFWLKWLGNI